MKHIIDTDELEAELQSAYRLDDLITAIRTLVANSPQADGMVLVPSEPTEEMKYAAVKEAGDIILKEVYPNGKFKQAVSLDSEMFGTAYKAMLSAYKPQADDVRKDAERWRTFREIASEEMCYALCGNSNAENDELDQAIDKLRE